MEDPFASVIAENLPAVEEIVGGAVSIELTGYTELRRRILFNAFGGESQFDLISIDMGWGREVLEAGLVQPLDALLEARGVELSSYLPSARAGAIIEGQLIGLPVQPHAEVLFYDLRLFTELGLAAPETTDEVLALAARLNGSDHGRRAGICWNAQRGAALGQTMLHFLAAFGGRPIDDAGRAALNTPEMRAAIDYALALVALSPSGILSMAWDERIEAFAAGRCAMVYGWTGRTLVMQRLGLEIGGGAIGVTAAPNAPGKPSVSPLGVWLLALPANLAEERRDRALHALLKLTSVEANRLLIERGVGALVHTPLMQDADLGRTNPAFRLLGKMETDGALATWMRPNITEFQALTEILGTEVHAVLTGQQDAASAAAASQAAFAELLER